MSLKLKPVSLFFLGRQARVNDLRIQSNEAAALMIKGKIIWPKQTSVFIYVVCSDQVGRHPLNVLVANIMISRYEMKWTL
ncbi:MAG: hypothetical protein H7144_18695 [Burkholderiales bacterium]|nr:hypothetical protein [Phycisphaerae bacterium]